MEIRLAMAADMPQILKYDCHIPSDKVGKCIEHALVDALWDVDRIVGILRYNLFWQTIPFLDLIYIDEAYRGQGWGSKMMANWEENMKRMGYSHVMLSPRRTKRRSFSTKRSATAVSAPLRLRIRMPRKSCT